MVTTLRVGSVGPRVMILVCGKSMNDAASRARARTSGSAMIKEGFAI